MSLLALTRLSMEPETGWPLLRHYPSVSFSSERTPVASIIAAAAGMPNQRQRSEQIWIKGRSTVSAGDNVDR